MRVFFSAISGNAIDTATFLLNRNLPLRTTLIGIPLISLILFIFFQSPMQLLVSDKSFEKDHETLIKARKKQI